MAGAGTSMGGIFISYRRDDSAGHAGRIFDHLTPALGEDNVFLDVDDIRPGQVFPGVIRDRIATAAVVVVVIGPRWLEILHSRGGGDADYAAKEIELALAGSAL